MKDAYEYLNKLIQVEHFEHFKKWAELKNLDINTSSTWDLYSAQCIPEEEWDKFIISKISYTNKSISAMLRMFAKCVPLGCSYENNLELTKYLETLKLQEQILKGLNSIDDPTIEEAKRKIQEEFEEMNNEEVADDGDE